MKIAGLSPRDRQLSLSVCRLEMKRVLRIAVIAFAIIALVLGTLVLSGVNGLKQMGSVGGGSLIGASALFLLIFPLLKLNKSERAYFEILSSIDQKRAQEKKPYDAIRVQLFINWKSSIVWVGREDRQGLKRNIFAQCDHPMQGESCGYDADLMMGQTFVTSGRRYFRMIDERG